MLSEVAISFTCALTTISLRAMLNVADRSIFSKEQNDFIKSMTMNSIFPLLIGLAVAYSQGGFDDNGFLYWVLLPGAFFTALAAQMTAYSFSWSFKQMPVRNVVVTCKLADIFLPFCIWAISGGSFNLEKYLFSIATVLAFIPILRDIIKSKTEFYVRLAVILIVIVLIQPLVNEKLQLRETTDSWSHFLAFLCAVYFWRSVFVLFPLAGRWAVNKDKTNEQKTFYHLLFIRSAIAYVSSAFFFFAIIHGSPILTWPIVSAGPLISTYMAYIVLNERMGKAEMQSLILFLAVVAVYVGTKGL